MYNYIDKNFTEICIINTTLLLHMYKIENEVKIEVNKETFCNVLSNFSKSDFRRQKNIFFRNSLGEIIRLRYEEENIILTSKKKIRDQDKLKISEEYEINLNRSSEKSINDLISFFGFKKIFSYTKYRRNISFHECVISFDKTGKNCFYIEIEGEEEKIWSIVKKLGLEDMIFEKKSYLEIFGGVEWVA